VQVAEMVVASMLHPTVPVFAKIARLFLISDILHNSGLPVQNAWKYRARFLPNNKQLKKKIKKITCQDEINNFGS
jgi:hypothetical protein